MKKYYPILLSKKGEIGALQHLSQSIKDDICPIMEVLNETLEKKITENKVVRIVYKDDFEKAFKGHWIFFNNQCILDFSFFVGIENKIDVVKKLFLSLLNAGVNAIPAIQSDSHPLYIEMVKNLIKDRRLSCCFRTSKKDSGFDNYKNTVENLIKIIEVDTSRIILLVDLGYATSEIYSLLSTLVKSALRSLPQKVNQWLDVVLAAGSFPQDLAEFKNTNNIHKIKRYEWDIWMNVKNDIDLINVKYGDFGIKHPIFQDVGFSATISIRYTIKNEFVIYKGKLTELHDDGHGQYITHSKKIVNSEHYSGKNFSWGDLKILEISQQEVSDDKKKTGNPTTWVQISQNHHITLIGTIL